jgi:Na+-transporting NADH:ubiquinone oxidoreductase subunit C
MKKEGFFPQRIYPILFMALLTVVFIAGVSGIYLSTKERVELNETIVQKKAVLYAAGIEYPADNPTRINEIYAENVREVGGNGRPDYYEIELPNGDTGYGVYVEGAGLWGQIVTIFGFRSDLETITGMEVVEQSETPGLGARINEPWFKEQFRGKTPPFEFVPEGTASGEDELDAITGASKTTAAMERIANKATEEAKEVIEEEG